MFRARISDGLSTLAIILTCVLAVSRTTSSSEDNRGDGERKLTILQGNNFKLTARVLVLASGDTSGVSADVAVNEFYSNEFKRAKITLKWQKFDNWITSLNSMISYIHENGRSSMMRTKYGHQSRRGECQLAEPKQFVRDLFSTKITEESADLSERHWFNNKRLGVAEHLIGLARLLAIVDSNRNNLVPVNEANQIIRNHETKKYSLSVDLGSGTKVNMRVYIGQGADTGPQAEFPYRVGFQTPEGTELVVDFYSLEPIRRRLHWNEIYRRYVTVEDLFAYPTGGGCCQLLKNDYHNPWAVHLYESERKVVSFRMELAEFKLLTGDERHVSQAFVAYDGYAKAYRRDQLRGDSYTITIHDALAGRKYNIRQPMATTGSGDRWHSPLESTPLGNKLKLLRDSGDGGDQAQPPQSECFSTMSPDSMLYESPYEPVLPVERLVDMGLAIVRGTLCKILETTSTSLPRLFFAHVAFSDQENNLRQKFKPDELSGDSNETLYTIDYYVAVQNTTTKSDGDGDEFNYSNNQVNLPQAMKLGQLMRVTVSQNGFLLYRVEVHEFFWSLSDAPNGDKQEELFSLKDRCNSNNIINSNNLMSLPDSSEAAANSLGESDDGSIGQLSLDLVYTEAPQTASLKAGHIRELIGQAAIRNKAIVRALSQLSNAITASEIYEIKSKVHSGEADDHQQDGTGQDFAKNGFKRVEITASLRLIHSRPPLYHPISLSNGTWAQWRPAGDPIGAARTFDECLWMASQFRLNHRSLLFSYCYDNCAIDLEADLEFPRDSRRPKLVNSDVFELGDHYKCPIFYLDVTDDVMMGHRTKSWPYIYSTLSNKLLTMPLLESNSDPPVENLFFKVDRIELNNLNWWRSSPTAIDDTKGMVGVKSIGDAAIDGLGLIMDDRFVRRADDLSQASDQLADSLQTSSMDVSSCHAKCLADLRCKTYSTCLVAGQIECHLATLSLRSANTLQDISKKVADFRAKYRKQSRKNNTIEIEASLDYAIVDANSVTFDENGEINSSSALQAQKASIKLRVDKRCRIHHKIALELFRQIPRSSEVLLDRNLIAASSVEECAEFCLQKNAQFFSRMSRSKSRIAEQLRSQPEGERLVVRNETQWRLKLLDDMKYWCSNFKYSDLGQGSVSYQIVGKLGLDKVTKGGICSLTRPSSVQRSGFKLSDLTNSNRKDGQDKLRMDNFEFIYSNLYERQRGIRLLGSIAKPSNAGAENGTTFAMPMVLNQQAVEEQSLVENCARACFSQTLNMVPWCRSFDLMEIEFDSKKSAYCIYNSMTLQEASKFDQFMVVNETYFPENQPGDRVMTTRKVFWHFEPRSEYSLDNIVLETMLLKSESDTGPDLSSISSVWSRLLICMLAIVTGISITGLVYKYCAEWMGRHDGPRLSLSIPVINDDQLRDEGGL